MDPAVEGGKQSVPALRCRGGLEVEKHRARRRPSRLRALASAGAAVEVVRELERAGVHHARPERAVEGVLHGPTTAQLDDSVALGVHGVSLKGLVRVVLTGLPEHGFSGVSKVRRRRPRSGLTLDTPEVPCLPLASGRPTPTPDAARTTAIRQCPASAVSEIARAAQ